MVSPVSNVSFGNKIGAMDKVSQQQLGAPGMYYSQGPEMAHYSEPKKKGGFLSFLLKTILAVAIIGGGIFGSRKLFMKDTVAIKELPEGAKFGEKFKNTFIKISDWIENTVKKPFTKKAADDAPKPETPAPEGAA